MLQTIYEGESSFSTTDSRVGAQPLPTQSRMHNVNSSVEIKSDIPLAVEPLSPLDLRTDLRMLGPGSDPGLWERQLQQELLLIQKQQQIQKQLLISEFQKQHEKLTRQHQAQLQEHLKLQQELQAMKQQQELAEKERRLEQQQNQQHQQNQLEKEQERHRRELHISSLSLRAKERSRESAVASTEVKQKLQDFLLSKSAKDPASNGVNHSFIHHPKLWYRSSHHTSLDQSSPPLGGMSPTCHYTLPSPVDGKDDFPLRKTASEPNLKVRSRLKQKVAERRSSPMLKRKDGNLVTPYKKRALELMDSTPTNSAPGSGPSSPIGASSALGAENGPSSLPTTTKTERWPSQPRLFRPESSMSVLSLYTSPSLPNISFGLPTASSPISAALGLKDRSIESKHGLPGHLLQNGLESKVSSSHQALLQHLLQKEQMRQQKMLSTGAGSLPSHPPSPLTIKDHPSSSRPKLPKHRPLNRTQSAPLPQNTLAQLVIQQQHQHFLEKQKLYQHQVHINKLLSKSIEQLRQPSAHLQESEEEQEELLRREQPERMQEDRLPPGGVIRKHTLSSGGSSSGSSVELPDAHYGVIKVKEEPPDSEDEVLEAERSTYLHQVKGRLVIRAMI
ncbi:histone deacetylase 9-B isoform X1 [Corythoichthys intestinalis]|uniref:histone deacetylase 9-B isoform X1 n=2 Tax=Corythoichthys intestinalis TaxID=161448 RepID=UPI0025A58BE6|nr:histone deacetylase 9-B isoform X1 [Corythoichthys intestinalis]XP_061789260.1 histone deacetylase 9-B-like [Nerophis lumbriciformis]